MSRFVSVVQKSGGGAIQSSDLPSLPEKSIWIGDATGIAEVATLAEAGIQSAIPGTVDNTLLVWNAATGEWEEEGSSSEGTILLGDAAGGWSDGSSNIRLFPDNADGPQIKLDATIGQEASFFFSREGASRWSCGLDSSDNFVFAEASDTSRNRRIIIEDNTGQVLVNLAGAASGAIGNALDIQNTTTGADGGGVSRTMTILTALDAEKSLTESFHWETEDTAAAWALTGADSYAFDEAVIAKGRIVDTTDDVSSTVITVAETIAETPLYTSTVAANEPAANSIIKIHTGGYVTNATASDELTLNIYVGSTLVGTMNPAMGSVTAAHWHVNLDIVFRAVGGSGSVVIHGDALLAGTSLSIMDVESISTLTSNDIAVMVIWDAAKAGNIITSEYRFSEHKNYN